MSPRVEDRGYSLRLAELSLRTGVSTATLKYYLRERLLHPGEAMSRTQAGYNDTHVQRVRLVRALSEVGGLPLATIGRVLALISSPGVEPLDMFEVAQRTLHQPSVGGEVPPPDGVSRAQAWLSARGWIVDPLDPLIEQLNRTWAACEDVGLQLDEERLCLYADHVEAIARVEVESVPSDLVLAVRQVVLGTVMMDPVLAVLRRLAHNHVSRSHAKADANSC